MVMEPKEGVVRKRFSLFVRNGSEKGNFYYIYYVLYFQSSKLEPFGVNALQRFNLRLHGRYNKTDWVICQEWWRLLLIMIELFIRDISHNHIHRMICFLPSYLLIFSVGFYLLTCDAPIQQLWAFKGVLTFSSVVIILVRPAGIRSRSLSHNSPKLNQLSQRGGWLRVAVYLYVAGAEVACETD